MKPIAIIDYGAGNLRSVQNAFSYLNAPTTIVSQPDDLKGADKIVLPGVGAFGPAIQALRDKGFEQAIHTSVKGGAVLFGICLGLQLLYETSDEMGEHTGLRLLPGRVTRFPADPALKVPHMGWNRLDQQRDHPLLVGIPDRPYVYYVHSYYVESSDPADVLATTHYGLSFTGIAARDRVLGIQCHPEKSQSVGLRLLKNFVNMEVA